METRETYTCKGCGYKSRYPLSEEEMKELYDCCRMHLERRMNLLRLGIIIVACIALPILIYLILACL